MQYDFNAHVQSDRLLAVGKNLPVGLLQQRQVFWAGQVSKLSFPCSTSASREQTLAWDTRDQ